MTDKFEILDPIAHIRTRTEMYMGSTSRETITRFVMGQWTTFEYVPALFKMCNEILDNAIDEYIRSNGKFANKIDVKMTDQSFSIKDNGRGIPIEKVININDKLPVWRPYASWCIVNSGTSFDSERKIIGAHGLGSVCVNALSGIFHATTWNNGKKFILDSTNGMSSNKHKVISFYSKSKSGTEVFFTPDWKLFGVDSFDEIMQNLLYDRMVSLQITFPKIKFVFNGKSINEYSLAEYSKLFSPYALFLDTANVKIIVAPSEYHCYNLYVNGVNCSSGGSYISFITDGIVLELQSLIKKKMKMAVSKSLIKNKISIICFVSNFNNPSFDSQTKNRMTNSLASVKKHCYKYVDECFFSTLAKKMIKVAEIIEPMIKILRDKLEIDERKASKMAQKKLTKVRHKKHIEANGKNNTTLFLCEGDSAIGYLLEVRDEQRVGGYPLRGVPMNVWDAKPSEVLKNKELGALVSILNLDIHVPASFKNLSYDNIAILADADCVDKDTIVFTNTGKKRISDITYDDKLKGVDGVYNDVTNIIKTTKKQYVEVTIGKEKRCFSMNHKMMVARDNKMIECFAKDLQKTDKLLILSNTSSGAERK